MGVYCLLLPTTPALFSPSLILYLGNHFILMPIYHFLFCSLSTVTWFISSSGMLDKSLPLTVDLYTVSQSIFQKK